MTITRDEVSYVANLPGFIILKNSNYLVSAITQDAARLCGWKNAEQAIGRIDYDMPCKSADYADEFIKLDKLSLSSRKKLHAIQILCYDSEWKVLLTERTPIADEANKTTKLHITAMDITSTPLSKGILLLGLNDSKTISMVNQQANYIIDTNPQPLALTPKQELCLFLLIRGKTMKQIAYMMGISIKTVENHLDLLKIKLNCRSKSQLIEKAIDSGFLYFIPKGLLKSVKDI